MTTFIRRLPTKGYLDANLWVPKTYVNVEGTKKALTITSADQHSAEVLQLFKETDTHLIVPRNYFALSSLPFEIVDCRPTHYTTANIISRIKLDAQRPESRTQRDAQAALLASHGGILQLRCGGGKTVIALDTSAVIRVPTLIVVPDTSLMKQWQAAIEEHLTVPDGIGIMGTGKFVWQKPLVLATYHTLASRAAIMPEEVRRWFGLVFFDEGHHVPAPTWAAAASLTYGRRFILSATPEREDGMHVVNDMHVGPVLYKNMKQELTPRIEFRRTGFRLDMTDSRTRADVNDVTGELHLGKLAGFLGRCPDRLEYVLKTVEDLRSEGRRVLVLSNSVEELVNLASLRSKARTLQDYPEITPAVVGFAGVSPVKLDTATRNKVAADLKRTMEELAITIEKLEGKLTQHKGELAVRKKQALTAECVRLNKRLQEHDCARAIEKAEDRRLAEHLKYLKELGSTSGLLVSKVKAAERFRMLRECEVVFAIAKYGKEGLDEKRLDTVLVLEPMSSAGILTQVLGRILRITATLKQPALAIFLEDNISAHIAMCMKLRRHLNSWPVDEGGPLKFFDVGSNT